MQQKWSEQAWQNALPAYNAILKLPFLKELADGSLSQERFTNYITQDNLYLNDYSRVLAHIASRLNDISLVDTFLGFASNGVAMEKELHAKYIRDTNPQKSPACMFYTSVLKAQADKHIAVEAAAILPCFWVYYEVGKHFLPLARLEGNPFADWVRAYSDPVFEQSTLKAIEICDRLADEATPEIQRQMTDIYLQCTRLEWLFWHSAYTDLRWPEEIQ